ncbi:MAG: hypothetical protein K9M57_09795 [Phycisphaerae bacterium]|nr:hypothetical protein [Phycisphaerae bacterium]
MAKINFSLNELLTIAKANDIKLDRLEDIQVQGNTITVVIATGLPLPKTIKADIEFIDFDNGQAKLELKGNPLVGKFVNMVTLPTGITFNSPHFIIDVNSLIAQKVKGLCIESMTLTDGEFTITTQNTAC